MEVCIGLSVRDNNDSDITFKGEASGVVALKLDFTPQNWNTPQTVTLVAAEDNDYADGARDLDHDTRTSDYFAGTVWLAVTEIDNDEPPPAAPTGLTATAGDQSVALAWNDPADSSITGYEYRTRWAGVAWGDWKSISAANSHTVTGLENGKEYRFKLRAVNAGGVSKPGPQSAPWYVAATPQIPLPAAPSNLAVTPGDGYLDISWDAVSDATGYDVRAKTSGSSDWHDVAGNITATSHRYTTDATIDYVAVRGRNAGGAGPWAEISRAPAHGWRDTFISSGASGQSARAQAQLSAPTWGTITRTNGPVHKLHLNWTTVSGATGYNLACTDLGTTSSQASGWEWHTCGWVKDDGTVSYDSVPSNQTRPVTVTRYQRDTANGGGDFALVDRSYDVRIRAVNDTSDDASNWTYETNAIHAVHGKLAGLSATRGNGSITLTWTPNPFTTAYDVDCAEAVSGQTPAYTRCATLTGQVDTATSHTVTISNTSSSYTVDNTKTYLIQITSKNTWGQARMLAPPVPPATLQASSVSQTGATLTLSGYSPTSWYLKRTTPADTNCKSKTTATETLSTLTSGASYTYKAYSDSNCANELASVTFTPSASVSNLSATSYGTGVKVYAGRSVASGFTTGSNSTGYTLHGVTVKFKDVGATPADTLTVAVHAASGGNPAAAATHILDGDRPTGAGEYAYTCSGSCTLSADTTYFLALSGGHSDNRRNYTWDTTASVSQTNTPSSFGWAIADTAKVKTGGSWSDPTETYTGIFKVSATAKPALSASSITTTTATLTIANHDGNWWLKKTAPVDNSASCKSKGTTATETLSALTSGTSYTYKAYDKTNCNSADEIASVTFTTATPGSRDSSKDFNTLSAAGNNAPDGLWSDGTTMWVSDTSDDKVYAYTLATKARDAGKDISISGNTALISLASDGTTMWTADTNVNNKLFAYSISGKSRDASKDITLHTDNDNAYALWANSATIWVADFADGYIYAYTIATGARDTSKEFDQQADKFGMFGLWSDGMTMWLTDALDDKLYAYTLSDGSRDSTKDYTLNSANGDAYGIWSDGTTMWVADNGDDKIYAYHTMVP